MVKRKTKTQKENINIIKRIVLLITGLGGLIILFIYSSDFVNSGIDVNVIGYNVTTYFFAGFIIILGLIFSTLFKSGLLGKWRLD